MTKLKTKNKKKKVKVKNYESSKMAYNFSFVSQRKDYSISSCGNKTKLKLLEVIEKHSQFDKVYLLNLDKATGLETLPANVVKPNVHPDFVKSGRDDYSSDKFFVFRIGNNKERVIGKIIDNIFYVLFVDEKGKAYNHGS